jgi:hypothetical protein
VEEEEEEEEKNGSSNFCFSFFSVSLAWFSPHYR